MASALLTCKEKTIRLLGKGAAITVAAEKPSQEYIDRFGNPPDIYSREINYWLWQVAIDILKHRKEIRLLYVHTTDYPMHTWAPEQSESIEHLTVLDSLLGEAQQAAPDAAFLLTADHGMNYKKRCWDLANACRERGLELRFALSAEKDRYLKHHRTFGGAAWVWLKSPADKERAIETIYSLERGSSRCGREPRLLNAFSSCPNESAISLSSAISTPCSATLTRPQKTLKRIIVPTALSTSPGFRSSFSITRMTSPTVSCSQPIWT